MDYEAMDKKYKENQKVINAFFDRLLVGSPRNDLELVFRIGDTMVYMPFSNYTVTTEVKEFDSSEDYEDDSEETTEPDTYTIYKITGKSEIDKPGYLQNSFSFLDFHIVGGEFHYETYDNSDILKHVIYNMEILGDDTKPPLPKYKYMFKFIEGVEMKLSTSTL